MEINDRIRMLRNKLGLTMKEFATQISLSQPLLSLIENGKATITDRTISQICANWNVNEEWLRYGIEPMFEPSSEEDIKKIVQNLSFSDICLKLLTTFDTLTPEQQEALLVYAHRFILTLTQNSNVSSIGKPPSKEDGPARQALMQRIDQESSPASAPGSDETA